MFMGAAFEGCDRSQSRNDGVVLNDRIPTIPATAAAGRQDRDPRSPNLSDTAVEKALFESTSMREFVGIDPGHERVPDETTVCKLRHLLAVTGFRCGPLDAIRPVLQ